MIIKTLWVLLILQQSITQNYWSSVSILGFTWSKCASHNIIYNYYCLIQWECLFSYRASHLGLGFCTGHWVHSFHYRKVILSNCFFIYLHIACYCIIVHTPRWVQQENKFSLQKWTKYFKTSNLLQPLMSQFLISFEVWAKLPQQCLIVCHWEDIFSQLTNS